MGRDENGEGGLGHARLLCSAAALGCGRSCVAFGGGWIRLASHA